MRGKNIEKNSVKVRFSTLLFSFLIISTVYPQTTEIIHSNGEQIKLGQNEAYYGAKMIENGEDITPSREDPNEEVRLIVTFREEPVKVYQYKKAVHKKLSLSMYYSSLQTKHSSFRTSMNSIEQTLSKRLGKNYSYTIRRDFYHSLNGVAMVCKRRMIDKIRSIPMVKSVTIDEEVKCDLTESVKQIRADIVQDSLGLTGEGVLVGNIDTGMDYNNPALGGGFGPGYRVIGGYDFSNDDTDPIDDHGHGTHVAGIIGGKGDSIKGVAPDVKFLAVKVLSYSGSGYMSDVIAGIDYCLDPDGNPDTDDAVDVINMSLGGDASPENPLDSAVNNATRAGILSVVAAGNNSHFEYLWGTIGSPGTSETALTVGACDSMFIIPSFSSGGPNPINSSIKPEVIAPGVNILSAILNNKMERWSGTSMATPHVTGIAALLKQKNPGWSPDEIKAAIVNTAHPVNDDESIFVQGKGCVDALDAVRANLLVEPGVISFGGVDLASDVWKDTVKIKIANYNSETRNIKVNITDGLPSGATITFDKTTISLSSGEEEIVTAILTVPSTVPVLEDEPFAYTGNIEFISESDKITTPFSFSKSSTIVVNFNLQPQFLWLVNRKSGRIKEVTLKEGVKKYQVPVSSANSLEILACMKKDTLRTLNFYLAKHFIDDPTGLTYIYLSSEKAKMNMVDSVFYDINNNTVEVDSTDRIFLSVDVSISSNTWASVFSYSWKFPYNAFRVYTCQLDTTYFIIKEMLVGKEPNYFHLNKGIFGVKDEHDLRLKSGSENLFYYNVVPSYNEPYFLDKSNLPLYFRIITNMYDVSSSGFGLIMNSLDSETNFSSKKLYCNNYDEKMISGHTEYSTSLSLCLYKAISPVGAPFLRSSEFLINKKKEAVFKRRKLIYSSGYNIFSPYEYEVIQPGDTLKIEQYKHANIPDYELNISNGSLFLLGYSTILYRSRFFDHMVTTGLKQLNGAAELVYTSLPYWDKPCFSSFVMTNNKLQIDTEPLFKGNQYVYYKYDEIENKKAHIITDAHPYKILGQAGQSTLEYELNLPTKSSEEFIFPSLENIQVSVRGKAVDLVNSTDEAILRLNLYDPDSSITEVDLSLLLASGEEIALPVIDLENDEYNASIPNYLPKGFVDVKAKFEDSEGNKGELTLSPGFYFGEWGDNITPDGRVRMISYSLDNVNEIEMQIGDTLNYDLTYTNYGSDIAKDVNITFPTSSNFEVVGSAKYSIDSLIVGDTVNVPVQLIVKGKENTDNSFAYYKPSVVWNSNAKSYSRTHKIVIDLDDITTGIKSKDNTLPEKYALHQNYPNPFNPSTTIRYDLPKQSRVKIEIYNVLGKKVATLLDAKKEAGRYQVNWNAARYASGVYFCTLRADDFVKTKKLVLLK